MPDDLKNYGRRKHDLQGMLLGLIGAMGLMVLIYTFGGQEEQAIQAVACKPCHQVAHK